MKKLKEVAKKIKTNVRQNNERSARQSVLEDLFYDFNRSRAEVYKMNFIRGLFLGAGTLIGGTVIIALLVWILSLLSNIIPPLDNLFDGVTSSLESSPKR